MGTSCRAGVYFAHPLLKTQPASGVILPSRPPRRHPVRGCRLIYWTEFKNTILPWLLAGAVVTFLVHEHRETTGALLAANQRLAEAVEEQGKALEGVRQLLASQGYTLPPLTAPQ